VRLLVTGASGRLGTALAAAVREGDTPNPPAVVWIGTTSADADVRDRRSVRDLVRRVGPDAILHAAAYTDVAAAERERERCWRTNVEGTRHVADAAAEVGARLVHVSSDYVFWGGDDRPEGGYREDDPVGPVRNYYALTKLVAEEAARRAPTALIVRTSFRATAWPHPSAYDDLFTGQDYVDVIAGELALLLRHLADVDDAILHVVTERKSVHDLIARRTPDVRRGSRRDAPVDLPEDVSLNTDRWRAWKGRWAA
jgi:dTDP-4-dehydrorhamnose reductase